MEYEIEFLSLSFTNLVNNIVFTALVYHLIYSILVTGTVIVHLILYLTFNFRHKL